MSQLPRKNDENTTAQASESAPGAGELLLHPGSALKFVFSLLRDPRVSILRKLIFVVPIVFLFLALLAPETVLGVIAGTVLPVAGEALSLPVDVSLDWVTLVILGFALLRIFPRHVVSEYHQRLFHASRKQQGTN
jgi:hypothetical protein